MPKISQLPAGAAPDGTEVGAYEQSGATVGISLADVSAYVNANNTISINSEINWLPGSTDDGTARRGFLDTAPANHVGEAWASLNIEVVAPGSEANGPTNADYGQVLSIRKQGFAGGSPASGEIDGLTIFARQDGPDGLPSGDPDSSDVAGILGNVQNIGTCGFLAQYEGISTNLNRGTFAIDFGIRTQIGVLDMNGVGANKFGFGAIADVGVITHAFFAGLNGGTFTNILFSPQAVIKANGDYIAPNSFWGGGAWAVERSAAENGNTTFTHRGAGAMLFSAPEGVVLWATNNVIQFRLEPSILRPETNGTQLFGTVNQRLLRIHTQSLELNSTAGAEGALILTGTGTPEGAVTANVGSLFLRLDGGAVTTLYVKETGTGNTGWVAK